MPQFAYRAITRSGEQVSGQLEAETREAALRLLNGQGYLPVDVTVSAARGSGKSGSAHLFARRSSAADITLLTRELGLLLASGQTLPDALRLVGEDESAPRLQLVARRLRGALAAGRSLSEAMVADEAGFAPEYTGMIAAAEAAGTLPAVLERIAATREKEQKLRAKITSSLLYPGFLVATSIAVVTVLLLFVVPRFKELLGDQVERLPTASRVVLAASEWLQAHGAAFGAGLVAATVLAVLALRRPAGQRLKERLLFALPLTGGLMRLALTTRFCRTLGLLLASGLGLPAALALTRDVIGNERAQILIDKVGLALRQGEEFSVPLGEARLFPPMVVSLLKIGAASGTLAESSLRLADMYESKLETALQRLVTILEPAIILIVSLFIGFIVVSVMSAVMGVYDLTGS